MSLLLRKNIYFNSILLITTKHLNNISICFVESDAAKKLCFIQSKVINILPIFYSDDISGLHNLV